MPTIPTVGAAKAAASWSRWCSGRMLHGASMMCSTGTLGDYLQMPLRRVHRRVSVRASPEESPRIDPPSHSMIAPVMYFALSLQRNTAVSAISRLVP
jgi:hypothetical protein